MEYVYLVSYWYEFLIFLFVPHYLLGGLWRHKTHLRLTPLWLSIFTTPLIIYVLSPGSNSMLIVAVVIIVGAYVLGFFFPFGAKEWFSKFILSLCIVFPLVRALLLLDLGSIATALNMTVSLYALYCFILSISYFFRAPYIRKKYPFLIMSFAFLGLFAVAFIFGLQQLIDLYLLAIAIELTIIFIIARYFCMILLPYPDIVPLMIGSIVVPFILWVYSPGLWFMMFLLGTVGYLCQKTKILTSFTERPLLILFLITPVVFAIFDLMDQVHTMQPSFGASSITEIMSPAMGLVSITVGALLFQNFQKLNIQIRISDSQSTKYTPYWIPIIVFPLIVLSWHITQRHIFLIFDGLYLCCFIAGKALKVEEFLYWLTKAGLLIMFAFFMMGQHFALIPLLPWFFIDPNVQRKRRILWKQMKKVWIQTRLKEADSF